MLFKNFLVDQEEKIRNFLDIISWGVTDEKVENIWHARRICYAKNNELMKGDKNNHYNAFPYRNISFHEALKMTMISFHYNGECRKSKYNKEWSDRFLYSIITNNIIDDFTVSLEKSGDFGAVDRGYAAYLIKNIFEKQGDLNKCKDATGTNVQVGISGANVRISPYKTNDYKTTKDDESEFNKIDYINPHENVTVLRDEIKIRKRKKMDDFDKEWKLIDTGNRIGFIHSSTIGDSKEPDKTPGLLVFPFQNRSKDWEICQWYNTYGITHYNTLIHALDFAYGTGHSTGKSGCSNLAKDSEEKSVVAPANGKIVENSNIKYTSEKFPDLTCIKLTNKVWNGQYINEKKIEKNKIMIGSVWIGHMRNDESRIDINYNQNKDEQRDVRVAQGQVIGTTLNVNEFSDQSKAYAHVHISAYTTDDCSGTSVPLGTVFGEGYNFSSDNSNYQWRKIIITSSAY